MKILIATEAPDGIPAGAQGWAGCVVSEHDTETGITVSPADSGKPTNLISRIDQGCL